MPIFEGKLIGTGLRIAIVISRFNEFISSKLLEGAMDAFIRHDVSAEHIDVIWVPGAFEIPMAVQKVSAQKRHQGILCLGAVIRGETPHFDYVASEVSKGIAHLGLTASMPILYGVLTTDSTEQAIERAGTKSGNKGWSSAVSTIEMANLYRVLG